MLSQALDDGNFDALVDPRLLSNFNTSEMTTMVACAANCVRHSESLRPRMSQVILFFFSLFVFSLSKWLVEYKTPLIWKKREKERERIKC